MALIKDLEFDPQFTDKQYDRCIKFFDKEMEREYMCCTKYIIVGLNANSSVNPNAACHASLGYNKVDDVALVGTEIALTRYKMQECAAAWQFLDWMLNESFASRFIVNKPEHRTLEWVADNGIIVSSDVMQPLFQMIMIFSRAFSERSVTQFNKWKELVDDGFDPHFAYQVCMCVTGGMSQEFPDDYIVTTRTFHTSTYLLNMESMKRFCAGDLGQQSYSTLTYRRSKSVYGCHDLFQGPVVVGYTENFVKDLIADDKEFRKRLSIFRNEDSSIDSYRPPNPFVHNRVLLRKPDEVTYQEYFKVVIPYMKEKGMFYNAPSN